MQIVKYLLAEKQSRLIGMLLTNDTITSNAPTPAPLTHVCFHHG